MGCNEGVGRDLNKVNKRKKSNCGKIEKSRENKFTATAILQLCSPESRKTVSQDGRNRALDRKHQSFFDCLRLQISAVFSQRPICFDKDLSPSPRERRKEAGRENREWRGRVRALIGIRSVDAHAKLFPFSRVYLTFSPPTSFLKHFLFSFFSLILL